MGSNSFHNPKPKIRRAQALHPLEIMTTKDSGRCGSQRAKDQRSLFQCSVGKVGENGRLPFARPSAVKIAENAQLDKRKSARHPFSQDSPFSQSDDIIKLQTENDSGSLPSEGRSRKYLKISDETN